jgi:hypothetical protein
MNNVDSLLNKVRDGSDYDIAKLFITVFPDCQKFTDKEISIRLSEDIYDLINEKVKLLSKTMMTLDSTLSKWEFLDMQKNEYQEKLVALRSHKQKQLYISEIKTIR